MSKIHLARNPAFHAQTKNIEVHYNFIRECVLTGDIDLQHISTNLQTADIFTKALGADKLRQFTMNLCISTANQSSLRGSMDKEPFGTGVESNGTK